MAENVEEEYSEQVQGLLKADEKYLSEIPKVHNFDVISTLKHFDEEVLDVLTKDFGYTLDVSISNLRIGIGLFLIGFAIYSHFGVGPFPACRPILLAFALCFGISSLFFTYLATYVQKDSANLVIKPGSRYLIASSKSSSIGDKYTIILSEVVAPPPKSTASVAPYGFNFPQLVSLYSTPSNKRITEQFAHFSFLDERGYVVHEAFRSVIEGMLTKLKASKKHQ